MEYGFLLESLFWSKAILKACKIGRCGSKLVLHRFYLPNDGFVMDGS